MAKISPGLAVGVGVALGGAAWYFGRQKTGVTKGPNLNPFASLRESANVRDDPSVSIDAIKLDSTVINVQIPAPYAILGCGERWAMPRALVRGSRIGGGGSLRGPNGYQGDARSYPDLFFPPNTINRCRAPSAGRPWFLPVYSADRALDAAGARLGGPNSAVPPVEYIAGTPGYAPAPASGGGRVTIRGFSLDDVAWLRSTATRNYAVVDARRRGSGELLRLYVSNAGYTAWDNQGRNVPGAEIELTYKGKPVPAEVNPWAVPPWNGPPPGNGRIWADTNPALPWDFIAPPWLASVLSLGHKPMPNVRIR